MNEATELEGRISRLSDEELITMVKRKAADYREDALNYAKSELRLRGVDVESLDPGESEAESDSDDAVEGIDAHRRHPHPEIQRASNVMKSFIRSLSAPVEFCLVVFVTFWWGLISSAFAIISRLNNLALPIRMDNSLVALQLVFELAGLAAALWIGRIRGWSLETFGWRPSWKRTGGGLLLTLGTSLVALVLSGVSHFLFPETINPIHLTGSVGFPLFLLMSFINPVFEEVIEAGYFIHVLQRHGIWVAVVASALFRTLLHAYLGANVFRDVFPIGLIFGFAYWRWRQLWPLFVAHVIFDIFALLPLLHR